MKDAAEPFDGEAGRPTAKGLLPEVHARLARAGTPALARLWEALRARFAVDWATYCRTRGVDEAPEWDDFPYARPADLAGLLDELGLPYAATSATAPRTGGPPRTGKEQERPRHLTGTGNAARPLTTKPIEASPPGVAQLKPSSDAATQPGGALAAASLVGGHGRVQTVAPPPFVALPFPELALAEGVPTLSYRQGGDDAPAAQAQPRRATRRPRKARPPGLPRQLRLFSEEEEGGD